MFLTKIGLSPYVSILDRISSNPGCSSIVQQRMHIVHFCFLYKIKVVVVFSKQNKRERERKKKNLCLLLVLFCARERESGGEEKPLKTEYCDLRRKHTHEEKKKQNESRMKRERDKRDEEDELIMLLLLFMRFSVRRTGCSAYVEIFSCQTSP